MYKNVNEYYEENGKPLKCWHCEGTDIYPMRGYAGLMTHLYCKHCNFQLESVFTRENGKPKYLLGRRRTFMRENPQNEFINAALEIGQNVQKTK